MQYFIEIKKSQTGFNSLIHEGDPSKAKLLENLNLGKDAQVSIKDKVFTLGNLHKALVDYIEDDLNLAFDERGQFEIGHYLYSQVFDKLDEKEKRRIFQQDNIDIRIITDDEHVMCLPWVLMADKGIFLCAAGWSVSISHTREFPEYELPPSPRILIAAPEPVNEPETRRQAHLENLEQLLCSKDPLLSFGRHMETAFTWEEFVKKVKTFNPQIVYYYGHGQENDGKAELLFAAGENHQLLIKPAADFAHVLRNMEKPPYIVYVNCCQGDAAGFLGAGRQLSDFVPAVITNRTIAEIEAAQAQGADFWENVLIKGIPPHKAVSTLYSRLTDLDLSLSDVRWMTPVLHCNYSTWKSNPPKPRERFIHDPDWYVKVDRVTQFHTAAGMTRQMLREQKPKSLAFVWYGEQGQGINRFHDRLKVELRGDLVNTCFYEVPTQWPPDLTNPGKAFSEIFKQAFKVSDLEDISARIREQSRGASGTQTLVYVRHVPVTSTKLINPKTLKAYLEWWDMKFCKLLAKNQFALLGISFIVKNPPKFQGIMLEKEKYNDLFLDNTVFRLLDQMENLVKKDLLDFIHTHSIRIPIKHRDILLDRIMEKTRGHYEKTVEELKILIEDSWYLPDEKTDNAQSSEEDYDY